MSQIFRADINKLRFSQLVLTVGTLGLLYYNIVVEMAAWQWWAAALGMYFASGCMGVTATFHRGLSHNSYSTPKWLEYFHTFLGCVGGTSSSIAWVGMHRQHHRYPDTELDPHAPKNGAWGVLTSRYLPSTNYRWATRDLLKSKYHIFWHQYYYALLILWAALLYLVHPKAFLFCFLLPATVQVWSSTITNLVDHKYGYRNFNTPDESTNTWWAAPFNWGEAWHNNHHHDPNNWSFQRKWWEIDITGMYIRTLMKLGLATPLRQG